MIVALAEVLWSAAIVAVTVQLPVLVFFNPTVLPDPTRVPQVVDQDTDLSELPVTTAVTDCVPPTGVLGVGGKT